MKVGKSVVEVVSVQKSPVVAMKLLSLITERPENYSKKLKKYIDQSCAYLYFPLRKLNLQNIYLQRLKSSPLKVMKFNERQTADYEINNTDENYN